MRIDSDQIERRDAPQRRAAGECGEVVEAARYTLLRDGELGAAQRRDAALVGDGGPGGAFGGAAVLCYFLAIEHLNVGMATLLNYTAPVFTALWAWLFLGERIGRGTLGALALTTSGVALVIVGNAPPGSLGLGTWQIV